MLQCEIRGKFLSLYIAPAPSSMNEYMAIESGGYEQLSPIYCSMAGCFPEKLI